MFLSKNGIKLTPGMTVTLNEETGMWDGPCDCSDCKANPGWTKEKGSVLSVGGSLNGSFLASELTAVPE